MLACLHALPIVASRSCKSSSSLLLASCVLRRGGCKEVLFHRALAWSGTLAKQSSDSSGTRAASSQSRSSESDPHQASKIKTPISKITSAPSVHTENKHLLAAGGNYLLQMVMEKHNLSFKISKCSNDAFVLTFKPAVLLACFSAGCDGICNVIGEIVVNSHFPDKKSKTSATELLACQSPEKQITQSQRM